MIHLFYMIQLMAQLQFVCILFCCYCMWTAVTELAKSAILWWLCVINAEFGYGGLNKQSSEYWLLNTVLTLKRHRPSVMLVHSLLWLIYCLSYCVYIYTYVLVLIAVGNACLAASSCTMPAISCPHATLVPYLFLYSACASEFCL